MAGYHKGRNLTKELCGTIARSYRTRQELLDNDSPVYKKCRTEGWLDEFIPLARRPNFTKEFCRDVASRFNTRRDLELADSPVYQKCLREGWLQEFFGDPLKVAFTEEDIIEEASLYETRVDFKRGSPNHYSAANRLGLMDELIPHKQLRDLTYDFCKQELSKYSSITEVRKEDESLWEKSHKLGLFEELGMESSGTVSDNDAIYVIKTPLRVDGNVVYKVGVTSVKLGDTRVNRVISASGLNSELVILTAVKCKATALETELLKVGQVVTFEDKFDGCTEYRAYSPKQMEKVMKTIEQQIGRV